MAAYGSVERMLGIFESKSSEEIPLESEPLFVNVNPETVILLGDPNNIKPSTVKEGIKSILRSKKTDHLKRAKTSAVNGSKGEELVIKYERDRLILAGKPDLASRVERVSLLSDSYGFDIKSFDINENRDT